MNYEQALDKLTKYGQQHLLHFYGELNEAQKKRLLSQIEATDFEVLSSMDATHKTERGRIAPLEAMQLPEIEKKKEQFCKTGLDAIPPPIVYGSSLFKSAFWNGSSIRSSQPAFFSCSFKESSSTRIPMEDNSSAISRT